MGFVGDFLEDTIDSAVDFVSDTGDALGEFAEDTYKTVVQPAIDLGIDLTADFVEWNLDVLDDVGSLAGIDDITGSLHDINEGVRYLSHEAADGNWKAAATLAVLAGSLYLAAISGGSSFSTTLSILGNLGLSGSVAVATGYAMMAIIIAAQIASIYGVALSLEQIGKYAQNPSALFLAASEIRDRMNLAFTNAWINGSMNLWMAGGILYDSPRAGDIKFNVTGDMNTTKFLNMQSKNNTNWSAWESGKYHDFQKKVFGNLAGNEFFAVSPLAQRI